MGLFDFFKKKPSDEEMPIKDEDKIVVESENTDDSAPGWEAIDAEFNRIYPDQSNPLHYGTVIKYMLGGSDPLGCRRVLAFCQLWFVRIIYKRKRRS